MLQPTPTHLASIREAFVLIRDLAAKEAQESDDADASLDETAQTEREYVRQRLREELKREPTEPEIDEWLRQHTEGY